MKAPMADAGADKTIPTEKQKFLLNGSASKEGNYKIVSFVWKNQNGDTVCEKKICELSTNGLVGTRIYTLTVTIQHPHPSNLIG